jgi:phosphonate degradation associated HDIG domain protein
MTGEQIIARLNSLFRDRGAVEYFGEAVTVAQHMLQCAALACAENAPDTLVAAALLHDIGHLLDADLVYSSEDPTDHGHEEIAAAFLKDMFPAAVVEPIRLHVAAKRYLCTREDAYRAALSPASQRSLMLQGGVMTSDQAAKFEYTPFSREAVRVRRWDDSGKIAGIAIPSFAYYRPMLLRLMNAEPSC